MSDLIDRQALDNAFTSLRFNSDGELAHWGDREDWCLHGSEIEKLIADAPTIDTTDAIEDLKGFLAEAERDRDEYMERMEKEQERVLDLQARLGEAENSVENYKRMWLEKHEPKIGRWKGWTATHWTKQYDANGDPIYSEHTYYECSYCGRKTAIKENFCPNCGAVMQDMEVQE